MQGRARLFNILTLVMLSLTLLVIVYYAVVAANPQTPLNPFPPPTTISRLAQPARTRTPRSGKLPPTWTPTATPTATPTNPPTFTPTPAPPTKTPGPTRTPRPTFTPTGQVTRSPYPFTYELTYETPWYGCDWAGVAGLVQDLEGKALTGYAVRVWGGGLDQAPVSGDATMYGESGWEVFFNNYPITVSGEYKVQLHDKNPPHAPVSEIVTLDFEGLCSKSMAFIVFTQNH